MLSTVCSEQTPVCPQALSARRHCLCRLPLLPRTGDIHILPPPYAHSWEDASLTLEDEA